jgi:hypothetical protein
MLEIPVHLFCSARSAQHILLACRLVGVALPVQPLPMMCFRS